MSKMKDLLIETQTSVNDALAVFEHDLEVEMIHEINKNLCGLEISPWVVGEARKREISRIKGMIDMLSVVTHKVYTIKDGEVAEVEF